MYSLLYIRFNWYLFLGIALFIYLLFPDLSWYSYTAILISIHQFILLFNSFGFVVPVRYIFGCFMCLQFFIGPMLAYNGLDEFQFVAYKMKIAEWAYFSYALPAVISFILGLHIFANKLEGEILDQHKILKYVRANPSLPYLFIILGFASSLISTLFSTDFAFVFILIGGLKFIGLMMLLLGNIHLKIVPLIIVIGSIIISSLGNAMFHDLLTWFIFIGAVVAIKFRPGTLIKLLVTLGFILLSVIIQQLKGDYRANTVQKGEEGGVEAFAKTYQEKDKGNTLFSLPSLATSNVRINQGFIITNIMKTVPERVPYSYGKELSQILEAALLPRIIAPNKLNAGDITLFKKYSGIPVAKGTSMGLSSLGDAYINFGIVGGCIFMFLLGLIYSEVLKLFLKYSIYFPVLLLFVPLVFYYPIRPDCELQTILGHLVKSCFLIFVVMQVWKNIFKVTPTRS